MSDIDIITERADKFARIIMDQLAADRCGNLENIRNALLAPLIQAHAVDTEMAKVSAPIAKPTHQEKLSVKEALIGAWQASRRAPDNEPDMLVDIPVFAGGVEPHLYRFKAYHSNSGLLAGPQIGGLQALVDDEFMNRRLAGGVSAEEARQKAKITEPVHDPMSEYVIAPPGSIIRQTAAKALACKMEIYFTHGGIEYLARADGTVVRRSDL